MSHSHPAGRRAIPSDPVLAVAEALAGALDAPDYKVCARCLMDTTHAEIEFDADGICNFCRGYDEHVACRMPKPADAARHLETAVAHIKARGRRREYDCVIGVSGGVDSSYVALLCKDWGLRPLLVQFDNGWNTELANSNIQAICEATGFDLHTYVVDWAEFRDLQLAFLKAGLANVEAPSDHGIFACLYLTALQRRIRYLLAGVNHATESNSPSGEQARRVFSYGYRYDDLVHLLAVHRRFGARPLKSFPTMGYWRRYCLERTGIIRRFDPLNCMTYVKASAITRLQERTGWRPYPGKHFESVITRFHQSYILPVKFGVDKRRLHLSGLIWSGQLSRPEGEQALAQPPCPPELLRQDFAFVTKKLELSQEDFLGIMRQPAKSYSDYPNRLSLDVRLSKAISQLLRRLRVRRARQ